MVGRLTTAVLVAIALVACGSGDQDDATSPSEDGGTTATTPADATAEDAGTTPADGEATGAAATAEDDEPPPAPASDQTCGDPATTIEPDEAVSGEVAAGESAYYCVEVPSGLSSVTVTLTDLTDDLDLYVAHDTFEGLGGGVGLRFSDANGTDDESITIEPSAYRGELIGFDTYADVTPGPYWIEVLGQGSPYTLTVAGG